MEYDYKQKQSWAAAHNAKNYNADNSRIVSQT